MDRVWEAQSQHPSMLANVTSAVQKPQSSTGAPNTNKYGGYFDMSQIFHCSVTLNPTQSLLKTLKLLNGKQNHFSLSLQKCQLFRILHL